MKHHKNQNVYVHVRGHEERKENQLKVPVTIAGVSHKHILSYIDVYTLVM